MLPEVFGVLLTVSKTWFDDDTSRTTDLYELIFRQHLGFFLNCKFDSYLLGPVRTCLLPRTYLLVISRNGNNFENINRDSKWVYGAKIPS
jgi:hypothetical protein